MLSVRTYHLLCLFTVDRYTDYVMPFMIQYLRNLHEKVEAVDARTKVGFVNAEVFVVPS